MFVGIALAIITSATTFARDKDTVILGTATPGGGFPVYGDVFAQTINETDPALHVQPRNTKGSTENVPLLKPGNSTLRWFRVKWCTKHSQTSAVPRQTSKSSLPCIPLRACLRYAPIARIAASGISLADPSLSGRAARGW